MHFGFIATGEYESLRIWEKWVSTRTCNLPVKKPDGTLIKQPINLQLRPVNFYELIFPKEDLDIVLNTMSRFEANSASGMTAKVPPLVLSMIRKTMNYKKIPEWDKTKGKFPMPELNVRTYGLGIREDVNMSNLTDWDHEDDHEAL